RLAGRIGPAVRARMPNEQMALRKLSGVRIENGGSETLSPIPMAGRSRGLDPSQERGLAVQRDAFRRGATWPPLMPYKVVNREFNAETIPPASICQTALERPRRGPRDDADKHRAQPGQPVAYEAPCGPNTERATGAAADRRGPVPASGSGRPSRLASLGCRGAAAAAEHSSVRQANEGSGQRAARAGGANVLLGSAIVKRRSRGSGIWA